MNKLRTGCLLLAALALTAEAQAGPRDYLYRVKNIKKITISHDPEQAIGTGSSVPIQVKAELKNGKVRNFTKWGDASIEVVGGKLSRGRILVPSALEEIVDHQVEITITLDDYPDIRGSETILLNYREPVHANCNAPAGADGGKGSKGISLIGRNGADGLTGGIGEPGADGPHVEVYVRREPGLTNGHELVRATVRTVHPSADEGDPVVEVKDYLFNAVGGSALFSVDGGAGGDGGTGGKGRNGLEAKESKPAGRGGDGGSGGFGGSGGSGGKLTVYVHPDSEELYQAGVMTFSAAGGPGGLGGKPGKGGYGGAAYRGENANRPKGAQGSSGSSRGYGGKPGEPGTVTVVIEERHDL